MAVTYCIKSQIILGLFYLLNVSAIQHVDLFGSIGRSNMYKSPQHEHHTGSSLSNSSFPYDPIYDNCVAYLKEFGKHSANFIRCTAEMARPFRFCEYCVTFYKRTIRLYEDIQQNDKKKDNCSVLLLNADHIQVLSEVYKNIQNIWSEADCDGCFAKVTEDINGTVTSPLSNDANKFLDKYHSVIDCVEEHRYGKVFNTSVCDDCRKNYTDLNNFFKRMRSSSNHHVCMDLVDMMNYTRLKWGGQLHCTRHYPDDAPVVVISGIFCSLPLAFYVAVRYLSSKRKQKLMIPRRMSRAASRSLFVFGSQTSVDSQGSDSGHGRGHGGQGTALT